MCVIEKTLISIHYGVSRGEYLPSEAWKPVPKQHWASVPFVIYLFIIRTRTSMIVLCSTVNAGSEFPRLNDIKHLYQLSLLVRLSIRALHFRVLSTLSTCASVIVPCSTVNTGTAFSSLTDIKNLFITFNPFKLFIVACWTVNTGAPLPRLSDIKHLCISYRCLFDSQYERCFSSFY